MDLTHQKYGRDLQVIPFPFFPCKNNCGKLCMVMVQKILSVENHKNENKYPK
jgi:hypothetical protein